MHVTIYKPLNARLIITWLLIFSSVLIWSGIHPHGRLTWFLEVLPALAGLIIIIATYRYFRFTKLAYLLMLIHAIILMIGGHYTYAEVPLFNWMRDTFDLGRNHYDKIGHFAQGFVPAIVIRELLIRKSPVTLDRWLFSRSSASAWPSAFFMNSLNAG